MQLSWIWSRALVSHVAELAFQHGLLLTPAEAEASSYQALEKTLAEDARTLLAQAAAQDQVSLHSLTEQGKIPADDQGAYVLPTLESPDSPSVVRQALARGAISSEDVAPLFVECSQFFCSGCQRTFNTRGLSFPTTLNCLHCGGQAWLKGSTEPVDDDATIADPPPGLDPTEKVSPGALVGTEIGRWSLKALLGKGAVGAVYMAEAEGPDGVMMKAALKIILPHLDSDQTYLLRFRQEARVTRSLQHEGIIRFLDYAEEPVPHLALELVDWSLADYLKETGRLSVREVLDLAVGIVAALAYAHDQNVVHRDLKPANILLNGTAPVLADFGLGRGAEEDESDVRLTLTGQAMGTPHYMAPEQINDSKHVGPGADVYSAGAIVFALLAGQPPFTGPTAKAFMAHFKAKVPDVRCWAPDVPSALVTLISDMMAKTPEKRPSTQATLERLETIRSKLPAEVAEQPERRMGVIGGWTLLKELRSSGAGRLYLCNKGEEYASLLMLPSEVTPDDAALKRYRQAIATLRRAQHPNVAEVLEVGLVQRGSSRRLYVISERPGDDLFQLLGQISALWPMDAVTVVIGAARALAAAHAVGVVHGSVKPESIVLADGAVRSDAVRVADFGAGFSLDASSKTRVGGVICQPHTMAPERATDEVVGAPADVYGLGATLFQLLTGSTLYAGPTATLLVAHATKLPDRADHRSGRVPRELGLIIDLALVKQPDERPTMPEFLELLESYAAEALTPKRLKTVRLRAETARKRFAKTRRF